MKEKLYNYLHNYLIQYGFDNELIIETMLNECKFNFISHFLFKPDDLTNSLDTVRESDKLPNQMIKVDSPEDLFLNVVKKYFENNEIDSILIHNPFYDKADRQNLSDAKKQLELKYIDNFEKEFAVIKRSDLVNFDEDLKKKYKVLVKNFEPLIFGFHEIDLDSVSTFKNFNSIKMKFVAVGSNDMDGFLFFSRIDYI